MADVYVDGTHVGQTPLLVSLIIGEHTVFIRKQNIDSDFQYPTVIKDSITDIHLTMRKSAKIAVEEENIEDDQPFVRVEQMPSFMGGDLTTFRIWVMQQVRYPQIAQENNITGRVMLQFVIEKDGSLTNIKVIQTPDSSLSDEAIRVLKTSPKWTPGKQGNKTVRVKYTLPVEFRIQN
jgi:TonB family protein